MAVETGNANDLVGTLDNDLVNGKEATTGLGPRQVTALSLGGTERT
jgi:hypothetical protein